MAGLVPALFLLVAWKYLPMPLLWGLGGVVVSAIVVASKFRDGIRVAAVNIAAIAFLLGTAEAYLSAAGPSHFRDREPLSLSTAQAHLPAGEDWEEISSGDGQRLFTTGNLNRLDPYLGYTHAANARGRVVRYDGGFLIYDVEYRTAADTLRRVVGADGVDPAAPAIALFGGSHTFGLGVAEPDTAASIIQAGVEGRYRVLNFGTSGAGASNMLAEIESGLVESALGGRQLAHAIYGIHPHHVQRAVGDCHWAEGIPKYELRDGRPVHAGLFQGAAVDPAYSRRVQWLLYNLGKSALLSRISERFISPAQGDDLFLALIREADRRLQERYGIGLTIVHWKPFGIGQGRISAAFRDAGIREYDSTHVFRAFSPETHYLPRYDHGNARAQREFAEFVLENVIE
jgi:hypothetical protein